MMHGRAWVGPAGTGAVRLEQTASVVEILQCPM